MPGEIAEHFPQARKGSAVPREADVSTQARQGLWPRQATRPIPRDASVKSAVRALEVIELFSLYRRPLSVNDVCHILEIPQSSASTLLKCLNRAGFIDRDRESRCYTPSLRSALLGSWASALHLKQGNLVQALDGLAERTGCSVRLAVRNRIFAQYVHVVWRGAPPESDEPRPGMLQPLCHDAIGEMLLADLGESVVRGIIQHTNAVDLAGRRPVEVKPFLERLKSCRAAGYAETWCLDLPHERVLAVAPAAGLEVPAVIAFSAPPKVLADRRDTILREVRAARLSDAPPHS